MEQGNPIKVNAIVNEIVKNNNIFKLKSPLEQDKEKDSMARSINSALSALNEVGKELVLQDLSIDPDEKFKGFIDSAGNIDISGLAKFTTTIVKAKIEEAEREGIDLRKEATQVFKDNKSLIAKTGLALIVIDTMIRDFDKLSFEDRNILADNWLKMTNPQKFAYRKALGEILEDKSQVTDDPKETKQLKYLAKEAQNSEDRYKNTLSTFKQLDQNEQIEWIEDLIGRKLLPHELNGTNLENLFNSAYFQQEFFINKQETILINQLQTLEKLKYNPAVNPEEIAAQSRLVSNLISYTTNNRQLFDYRSKIPPHMKSNISTEKFIKLDFAQQRYFLAQTIPDYTDSILETTQSDEQGTNIQISKEIQQIPTILSERFSPKEISEALKIYKGTLKSLEPDDIQNIRDGILSGKKDEVQNEIMEFLIDDGISSEIAEFLSKIDYSGNLWDILKNKEQRKEFFEQLEQVIENPEQHLIKDEHVQEGINNGNIQEDTLDASAAIEAQQEHTQQGNQQPTQKQQSKDEQSEIYSFINSEYLQQDSVEGLIPRNGANSKALQDDKTAVFYSEGKEGAIVMYFEFLKKYNSLRGAEGDKALQKYADYESGKVKLSEEELRALEEQLTQIKQIRTTATFDEYMGDKVYLQLGGIDKIADKQEADRWREAHPDTRMNYNYANGWTSSTIPPDRIDVVTLQNRESTDTRKSQKDMIMYFLSQTSIEKIEKLGVNDTTLEYIKNFYKEHSTEISQFGSEYSLVTQNIKEFAQERQVQEHTVEQPANQQVLEQTGSKENDTLEYSTENLPIKQDDSFIGKIKRVMANMRDMKNKDKSKGFFSRLGNSIKTVFGNKSNKKYITQEDIEQQNSSHITQEPQKSQTFDDRYHVNLPPKDFVPSPSKSQQNPKKIQDKQEDEKSDDDSLNI